MNILEHIIIGSGISGLYTGLNLKKKDMNNFLIIERNNTIGGRIKTFPINNNRVSMGAGVGRKKDKNLLNLLSELNIEHSSGISNFYYSDNIVVMNIYQILSNLKKNGKLKNNMTISYSEDFTNHFFETLIIPSEFTYDEVVEYLNENLNILIRDRIYDKRDKFDILVYNHTHFIYNKLKRYLEFKIFEKIYKPISFKNFCLEILDIYTYDIFIKNLSFTDYEEEDAYISLMFYNFEDNFETSELIYIKWDNFLNIFKQELSHKIILNTNLIDIQETNDGIFELTCEQYIETDIKLKNRVNYYSKKIIFANNLDIIDKHFDYNMIKNQPFLRVYCQLNKDLSMELINKIKINGSTIVNNQLCKIININRDDGIFMISYCDNQNAKLLNYYTENTDINKKIFEKLLGEAFNISEDNILIENIYCFYWMRGTHYFKLKNNDNIDELLEELQNPFENIYVVGECISKNQGWCEGALESVNNISKYL